MFMEAYKCKGKLRLGGESTKGIYYVNKDLTKKRLKMFKAAPSLKKDNSIQDCYTTDGKSICERCQGPDQSIFRLSAI